MFYNILLYLEKIKFIPITGYHKNKLGSFRGFECGCFVCVCVCAVWITTPPILPF